MNDTIGRGGLRPDEIVVGSQKVKNSNNFKNRGIFLKIGTKSGNFGFFTRSTNLLNPTLIGKKYLSLVKHIHL